MSAKDLLSAIADLACERHFCQTIEELVKDNVFHIDKRSQLFFELKFYASNFKAENTGEIVKLLEIIKARFSTVFDGEVNTVLYYAKILDILSILKAETNASDLNSLTLLSFQNAIEYYLPERTQSEDDENLQLYGMMKKLLLKSSNNLSALSRFHETQLNERWNKLETNFIEHASMLSTQGFHYVSEVKNSDIEGINIHEHPWWKEFQKHYPTNNENDDDETYKVFVAFVNNKVAKKKRKTLA